MLVVGALIGGCRELPGASQSGLDCWNPGLARSSIESFVQAVTDPRNPYYVTPSDRIAVIDNDGTMWVEKPRYAQLAFALDRVRQLAPTHPAWKTTPPFDAVIEGDASQVKRYGKKGTAQILRATHAGMTTEEFTDLVDTWIRTARHPRFDRPYPELAYVPMLQLIDYLKSKDFSVFIVSGGGVDFIRPWVEDRYGVPTHHVVGTVASSELEVRDDTPVLVKKPQLMLLDDSSGKPVAIHTAIGKRPILAVGNSDGDIAMLEWTTQGVTGQRLGVLIRHTDGRREYRYDEGAKYALVESARRGWTVVDMERDWRCLFEAAH